MKRLALLALPISFVFCLSLGLEDAFSRRRRQGWKLWRQLQGGSFPLQWSRFPQPFHEFLFPLAASSIAVQTAVQTCSIQACRLSASFDSEQGRLSAPQPFDAWQSGVSAPQFFRPRSSDQACRSWRAETEPAASSAILESSAAGWKGFIGCR